MALTNEEFLASLIAATDAGDTPEEALNDPHHDPIRYSCLHCVATIPADSPSVTKRTDRSGVIETTSYALEWLD